jgi:hypothetical protein
VLAQLSGRYQEQEILAEATITFRTAGIADFDHIVIQ